MASDGGAEVSPWVLMGWFRRLFVDLGDPEDPPHDAIGVVEAALAEMPELDDVEDRRRLREIDTKVRELRDRLRRRANLPC
jgi:hypothetical protein